MVAISANVAGGYIEGGRDAVAAILVGDALDDAIESRADNGYYGGEGEVFAEAMKEVKMKLTGSFTVRKATTPRKLLCLEMRNRPCSIALSCGSSRSFHCSDDFHEFL